MINTPLIRSTLALAAIAALAGGSAVAAPVVYGESAMVKVRPATPVRASAGAISLSAGRNEFVSFQVVVNGGADGATGVSAKLAGLSGPQTIAGTDVTLYREGLISISQPTPPNQDTGWWPDPLIPDTDEIANEKRKAFPFDVPASQSRAIWVDVHVPIDAKPGAYTGQVAVTGVGLDAKVPVTLTVVDATLPSTPSLTTAFRIFYAQVCSAHTGIYDCGGTDQAAALVAKYRKMALEHRLTLANTLIWLPSNETEWARFDAQNAPFLDGTVATRLPGAKMTSVEYPGQRNAGQYAAFAAHFKAKGWLSRAFDYTADEPPYGASFDDVRSRAALVRSAAPELRTLVTTTAQHATEYGLTDAIDVMVPVVNFMDGVEAPYVGNQRAAYDAHVAKGGNNVLWMYESCMSQGCGYGSALPENGPSSGWPSYMVDVSAARNRAMQWVDFRQKVSGELYYETAEVLPNAWSSLFKYNGNGDGTLFYPGTPAAIGGSSDVPVASVRLKLIRLGVQDYEWLKLVSEAGDPTFAENTAKGVFPSAHQVSDDGAALEQARAALIARYVQLKTPPSSGGSTGGGSSGSTGGGSASGGSGSGSTGGGTAAGGTSGHSTGVSSGTSEGLTESKSSCASTRGGPLPFLVTASILLGVLLIERRRRTVPAPRPRA